MGRTYYDCPCCEREVWVHAFWGAAWVGAVCHACRDDHGNFTTKNCGVNGPAKRRREQAARNAANQRARRQADQARRDRAAAIRRREREETERMQRLRRERLEKERIAEANRLKAAREKAAQERKEMEAKLAKDIADKKKAAKDIRKKRKAKKNPYKDFKKLEAKKFIQDIGNSVIQYGAAAEVLEGQIEDIKGSLKTALKGEFDIVKDEFKEYSKYVNGIKDLTGNFIKTFESIFDESKNNTDEIISNAEELQDSDNDEDEKKAYAGDMKKNMDNLCNAVDNMMDEVDVIEAYYEYMLDDCKYFDEFVKKNKDAYEDEQKDMDPAIKAILDDANKFIQDERQLNDPDLVQYNKTQFTASYETTTYIRGCNSLGGSMWNSIKDTTREYAAMTGDLFTLGTKGLYGKCVKKIKDEKRQTEEVEVEYTLEQFHYDGAKHKDVLKKFTSETLKVIEDPLKKVVNKYQRVHDKSKEKTEEIDNFKKNNFGPLKQKLEQFKTEADKLKNRLNDPEAALRKVDCDLMQKKWDQILYERVNTERAKVAKPLAC